MIKDFPFEVQQWPGELEWFASKLLYFGIRRLMTIGVHNGGVEWYLAKYYHEHKAFLHIYGVDVRYPSELRETEKLIYRDFPNVRFFFDQCTSESAFARMKPGDVEAIFVDGNHAFEAVNADVRNAVRLASRLVFVHDVIRTEHNKHTWGCADAWDLMKAEYPHESFSERPDFDKGIGVLILPGARGKPCPTLQSTS